MDLASYLQVSVGASLCGATRVHAKNAKFLADDSLPAVVIDVLLSPPRMLLIQGAFTMQSLQCKGAAGCSCCRRSS